MRTARRQYRRRGFLMMEVVLALGIFGIAATAFAVALQRTADAAHAAQRQMQVSRILESALNEALSEPIIEVGQESVTLDEQIGGANVEVDTEYEELLELENEDGQSLQEMYRVLVSVHWYDSGEWQKETAETWRYGRLYRP